jgi:hypothetical protein
MVKLGQIDYVSYLVNRKFPGLEPPPAKLEFPQSGGIIFSDEEKWLPPLKEIIEKAQIYRQKLSCFPKLKLEKLYRTELVNQCEENDQKQFFNLSDAGADFDYWSKMANWTLDEAIALSFGKNPEVVSWSSLATITSYKSPFIQEFKKIRALALRAVTWNTISNPMSPIIYVNWVEKNEITFPDKLAKIVQAKSNDVVNWKNNYDALQEKSNRNLITANQIIDAKNQKIKELENSKITDKPLHTKERETLLKLVIGMAVGGYRYQPWEKRNEVIPDIVNDLQLTGVSLDPDTVRKWLKIASDLLPRDYENIDC